MVFVIESAATRRSLRRFLGTPKTDKWWPFFKIDFSYYFCSYSHCNCSLFAEWVSPWEKASSTSSLTPARQSCGVWVGVEPAEVERMGMGMVQLALWLGEEWGEPPVWACSRETGLSCQQGNRKQISLWMSSNLTPHRHTPVLFKNAGQQTDDIISANAPTDIWSTLNLKAAPVVCSQHTLFGLTFTENHVCAIKKKQANGEVDEEKAHCVPWTGAGPRGHGTQPGSRWPARLQSH